MKIKSKSDVITNSSNEVFCFKMDVTARLATPEEVSIYKMLINENKESE